MISSLLAQTVYTEYQKDFLDKFNKKAQSSGRKIIANVPEIYKGLSEYDVLSKKDGHVSFELYAPELENWNKRLKEASIYINHEEIYGERPDVEEVYLSQDWRIEENGYGKYLSIDLQRR